MAEDIKVSEFIVNELSEEKLEELKSTNAVPPNEMFLTNEEGEQFTRGLPLGTIIPLAVVTDDPYLQPLDGRSLAQDGMYAEFCTWLKNRVLANSSNVPTCTIAEYATEMNTYFQCGKFVINDTAEIVTSGNYSVPANSIKLPTITEFIASNNGGDTIGLAELDEFKSHAHRQVAEAFNYNVEQVGYYEGQTGSLSGNSYKGNSTQGIWITDGFSEIWTLNYGGSETRPKNVRYPYYIVVATSLNNSAVISAEGVVSEVNTVKDVLSRAEQVDIVYDQSSSDNNINWGYTSGFKNISVTGKDFSKYKILRAYFTKNENSNANILEVGIRRDASENIVRSEATQDVDLTATGTNLRSLYIAVESNSSIAFNYIAGNSDYYRDQNAYCYKIEGVY